MLVVKRYPNRKLYDTQARRYVNLEDIGAAVRAGEDVQVVDHLTGDDLTDLTLTQVIVTLARRRATTLPRAVLSHLIRAGSWPSDSWRRQLQLGIDRLQAEGELSAAGADHLREMTGRSPLQAASLSTVFEQQMEATLHRMNLPSQSDMLRLRSQLDELARQVEGLDRRKFIHEEHT